MRSTSAHVLDLLNNLGDAEFNASSIHDALPETSRGGVSAFLHRLHKEGAITVTGRGKGAAGKTIDTYRVVDLSDVRIKENYNGRSHSTGGRGHSTREHLANLLMQIASEVEGMRGSLADFTTEDLLKEIGRRTRNT
jgi:hypothetical protein